ncbi:similar to ribosomal RNA processing exonuclease RRP41 [Cyanidioschyzon merolae strain 10D]|uniref:Similar to ribosomal RNA processing exonuclease RRP41 n=1 Tax=Cyanidioschyzon merolae (strain NIES-3377 / 10D) TaxID=280699 RepID=M1V9J4_CYAM1|nr:similar to ribosomal RNA processing exonuclease RRP41 [Cyanidioschyzon merolae strain 10D]BAM81559.1 similar to ribosomal RNA processing exonuclease RRP41 [Cyanidioschyzon merolae strain 10D]|eukprot:XP_005537595.1 similar to ribosomal RNA processing exonuclease RRP41 [Cyanidioschyzon merolae strain 10D]
MKKMLVVVPTAAQVHSAPGLRRAFKDACQVRKYAMKSFRCQLGVLSRPEGSAVCQLGKTKVVAAVFGPRPPQGSTDTDTELATVVVEYRQGLSSRPLSIQTLESDTISTGLQFAGGESDEQRWAPSRGRATLSETERRFAAALTRSLECVIARTEYPRLQFWVYIWVLEEGGSELALATTAAWAACLDAGVALVDALVGVSVAVNATPGYAGTEQTCIAFPTSEEEASAHEGRLWVALLPNLGLTADLQWRGATSQRRRDDSTVDDIRAPESFSKAFCCAQQAAVAMYPILREQLVAQLGEKKPSATSAWFTA